MYQVNDFNIRLRGPDEPPRHELPPQPAPPARHETKHREINGIPHRWSGLLQQWLPIK